MPHLSERADNFAKKLVKKPVEDTRPLEVKMAEFDRDYLPKNIKRIRRGLKGRQ